MTSVFDEYYHEFCNHIRNQQPEGCSEILKQMAVEARSVEDEDLKAAMLDKVKFCKLQLRQVERELARGEVIRTDPPQIPAGNDVDATLVAQNATLDRARRTAQETEEVAQSIAIDLAQNRETIEAAHENVRQLNGMMGQAQKLLNSLNHPFTGGYFAK